MSGQEGSRRYIYQGISAIFSCIENDWSNISAEYTIKNDKVDIEQKKSQCRGRCLR